MSHIRTTVRNAVVERLREVGGFGLVGPALRILRGFQDDHFPVAFVSVSDAGTPVGRNPPSSRPLQRSLTVTISIGSIDDPERLDETLDALAAKVEVALSDPTTMTFGKVLDWSYVATEWPSPADVEEYGFAVAKVVFRGTVTTPEGQPSVNQHQ